MNIDFPNASETEIKPPQSCRVVVDIKYNTEQWSYKQAEAAFTDVVVSLGANGIIRQINNANSWTADGHHCFQCYAD